MEKYTITNMDPRRHKVRHFITGLQKKNIVGNKLLTNWLKNNRKKVFLHLSGCRWTNEKWYLAKIIDYLWVSLIVVFLFFSIAYKVGSALILKYRSRRAIMALTNVSLVCCFFWIMFALTKKIQHVKRRCVSLFYCCQFENSINEFSDSLLSSRLMPMNFAHMTKCRKYSSSFFCICRQVLHHISSSIWLKRSFINFIIPVTFWSTLCKAICFF